MTESLTICKMIILYLLKRVNFPLSNSQFSSFILDREYTNYFTLQQAINELLDAEMISVETVRNTSLYRLTEEGARTLDYLRSKLPAAIRQDIDRFLLENRAELRNETAVQADYYRNTNGGYSVHCVVHEGKGELIELTVAVPDRAQAEKACAAWEKKCQSLYMHIMEELL